MRLNAERRNFRVVAPDELTSNRLGAVLEVTDRAWMAELLPTDEHLAPGGRAMEILSETTCQGWLEGYLLTGRHGLFTTYEAFVHIVDSMFNQHAKWLEASQRIGWRALQYVLKFRQRLVGLFLLEERNCQVQPGFDQFGHEAGRLAELRLGFGRVSGFA